MEVVGSAVDATTIKMFAYQPMGSDVGVFCLSLKPEALGFELFFFPIIFASDMKLLNQVIELTHDSKFHHKMFSESIQ